ncbi:MAG: EAL domain-containing protein [Lachnospiraceae bacterium]|nr:EAL domain-containing protein [Lachnospiraceae bacterium]
MDSLENKDLHPISYKNRMSTVIGFYSCVYDSYGKVIEDFDCSDEERAVIDKYFDERIRNEIFGRLTIDSIEDQIIEDTASPFFKIAAIALKWKGRCREVWFLCGAMADQVYDIYPEYRALTRHIVASGFNDAIDLVREMGQYRIENEYALSQSREENQKSHSSVIGLEDSLRRVETIKDLLKYMDNDNSLEYIFGEFLKLTAEYLRVDGAALFKVHNEEDETMDVVGTWTAEGQPAFFDKTVNIPRFRILKGNRPIIISSGSMALNNFKYDWDKSRLGVKAIVAMPLVVNHRINLYVTYTESREDRNWRVEDLQFLSDAIRILQSIVERRMQKNSLAGSYASLEQILEHVGCAIIVNDIQRHKTLFMNKIMRSVFPLDRLGRELNDIIWEVNGVEDNELELYDYDKGAWYEIHHSDISWVDGRPVALFAIYDVTDKKNYQRRIEQQAYTDFLTGLYNRMCCERDLACIIDEAKKTGTKGALCYIDLDDFKHINDGLGHQYGDVLLKAVSAAFKDVRGIEDTCYRMGGDEFALAIPPKSYAFLEEIVNNIKAIFAKPWYLKDADYYCTMSMGIVTFPDEGDKVDDLIKKADIAMYEAKKTGKNRVATYNSKSLSESSRRLDMEKNMRDAANDAFNEFIVYYQPVIDVTQEGNPCIGAEALIRWDSQVLGFVNPADFIPLAEYLGLINPIGDYVLREACKECKKWNDKGHPDYKVNVNLSVVQLMQNNIVESIMGIIEETGIEPRNLTLEVTESLAINDMERMKKIMSEIRQAGVKIALDDFGTGYSSLNHIREIPLDIIKVDQSFVKELVDDDYSKSFIKMVAELAGAINVSVCVEGIETEEQFDVLSGMKVNYIQGYYFSKPIRREEFEEKYL